MFRSAWSRIKDKAREKVGKEGFSPENLISQGWNFTKEFGIAYAAVMLVGTNIGFATVCTGPSMLPTIRESNDLVIVDATPKWSKHYSDFKKGDVIVSYCPNDPDKSVCKRIRGVGGDFVTIRDNQHPFGQLHFIPKGHVWLSGDNKGNSRDSRTYGPVPLALLQGRVLARVSLKNYPYFELLTDDLEDEDEMTPEKRNKINGHPNRSAKKATERKEVEGKYPEKAAEESAVKDGEQENAVKVTVTKDSEKVTSESPQSVPELKVTVVKSGTAAASSSGVEDKTTGVVSIVKVKDNNTSV